MIPFLPLNLSIRVGCNIVYTTPVFTPVLFLLRPLGDSFHVVREETCSYGPYLSPEEFIDEHGNLACRTMLVPGRNVINMDAIVDVTSQTDSSGMYGDPIFVNDLPPDVLRYTLPSRYCDSDKLMDFAWNQFGNVAHGMLRVQAICDWVHHNIEYRFGSGRSDISASDVIARRYGVCRDFAHVVIALCRAFNIPARYVTGHLPDVGFQDPGTPMDFHAYTEVYLGHQWHIRDARFNVPRIGRIKVSQGLDAVETAFSTIYGEATLDSFLVWAYQVNPSEVHVGDALDMSKRLDGTPLLRYV